MTIINVSSPDKNGKKAADLTRADFTIYEIGYVPMDGYVGGKFRKVTVKIRTKDGNILGGLPNLS